MMSLQALVDRTRAAELPVSVAFHFPGEDFIATVADGEICVRRGVMEVPDLAFTGDTMAMRRTIYGKAPLAKMVRVERSPSRANPISPGRSSLSSLCPPKPPEGRAGGQAGSTLRAGPAVQLGAHPGRSAEFCGISEADIATGPDHGSCV